MQVTFTVALAAEGMPKSPTKRKLDTLISGQEQENQEKKNKLETEEDWNDISSDTTAEYLDSETQEEIGEELSCDSYISATDWSCEQKAKVDFWFQKLSWIIHDEDTLKYKTYLINSVYESYMDARKRVRQNILDLEEAQQQHRTPGHFSEIEKRLMKAAETVETCMLKFWRNRAYRYIRY